MERHSNRGQYGLISLSLMDDVELISGNFPDCDSGVVMVMNDYSVDGLHTISGNNSVKWHHTTYGQLLPRPGGSIRSCYSADCVRL